MKTTNINSNKSTNKRQYFTFLIWCFHIYIFQKLKAEFDQKESKLDLIKTIGDDIASRGRPSLVQPYEKQIFDRLGQLEEKFNVKISDMEEKIGVITAQEQKEEEERLQAAVKQLEEEKLNEKKVVIVEEVRNILYRTLLPKK